MAETQKGASSSANSKEKSSLLDLDIGNDFLNSWKSISIGDDAMDFDFGPISTNKKKTFNFDKEDMNFNLDSSFSKMSSFKIDMSDLDISSPCKKNGKTKETSKEEPSGSNNKGKTDGFAFNFDFKELDSFNFESSPRKKDQTKKDLEIEGSSGTSAHQSSGLHLSEEMGALDGGMPKKHSVPELAVTSTADSMADCDVADPIGKNCSSNCTADNNDAPISATVTHKDELMQTSIFPMRSTSTNTEPSDFQIEKGTSPQSVAQEAIQDASHDSSEHESIHNAGSELLEEDGLVGVKLSSSDIEKDLEPIAGLDSNDENTMAERFPVQQSNGSQETDQESVKCENDKHLLVGNIEGNNTHPECTYIGSAKKDEHLRKVNEDIQEPVSRLLKAQLSSGSAVENLTRGKGDSGAIRSNFFMSSIEIASQRQKQSLAKTKLSAVGNKRIGTIPPSHSDGMEQNGKDNENGKKAGMLSPGSRSLPKSNTLQAGSQDSSKDLSNKTHLGISQQSKNMPQNTENSKVLESVVPSSAAKNTSIGGNKIFAVKAGRQTLDFSSSKLSKSVGANLHASQSLLLKDGKTLVNLRQNTSLKGIAQTKVADSITTSTQKPNITPLKRKTPETTRKMVLTSPFKRPSATPNEHRDFSGISERTVGTQDCYSKDQANYNKGGEYNSFQTSAHDTPQAASKKELGVLLIMEDDDNVDKAEAYAKELEDICNMLRKKHDEAKELLVRSIVNNNNLLMLNHPIYEEKIRVVKHFAAGLMKREIQAST